MALSKKNTKSSKEKLEKKSEQVGEFVGTRRPFIGAIFLFFALIFTVAFIDNVPGQEFFFRESFLKAYDTSTGLLSANLCGRVGATFNILFLDFIGAATVLVLVYLFWIGALCFQRRARPFALPSIAAMLVSIIAFACACAMFQQFRDAKIVGTNTFTSGWGGKLGTGIYMNIFHPSLRFFGSLILLILIYAFCMVVVFAENPSMLASELGENLRKTPSFFGKVFKVLLSLGKAIFAMLIFIPKKLFAKKPSENNNEENLQEEEITLLEKPIRKPRAELVEDKLSENSDEEAEDLEANALAAEAIKEAAKEDLENDENAEEFSEENLEEQEAEKLESKIISFNVKNDNKKPFVAPVSAEDASYEPATKEFKVSKLEEESYTKPTPKKVKGDYIFPSVDLLAKPKPVDESAIENYQDRMDHIVESLKTFNIGVTPSEAVVGPVITRYEVKPNAGVKIAKIVSYEDDIALGLKMKKVRVSVTDRGTVGIEVPNKIRKDVSMRDIIESKEWNESKAEIPVVLGKDVTGKPVVLNLAKMPHALIAGSTGSGKSVCINVVIASLLYHSTPDDLRFIMVDPKMVELQVYNTLPHMLVPVVTDPRKVPAALKWLVTEMMKRFSIFQKVGVRNIAGFNAKIIKDKEEQARAAELDAELTAEMSAEERTASLEDLGDFEDIAEEVEGAEIPQKKMPYIVCIIDELADLMMVAGKEVESGIARLAQLGRAAGIHMLVATQRPSTDVVTGLIKANLPTRIGFKVASYIDSRTILDSKGAETLIGWGDMLFIPPGSSELIRAQGAFISDDEISGIVEALKVNGEPEFEQEIQDQLDAAGEEDSGDDSGEDGGEWDDPMTSKAIAVIRSDKKASTSYLQRKLRIGYNRAASIMDELEEKGVIGPDKGPGNPRDIFI